MIFLSLLASLPTIRVSSCHQGDKGALSVRSSGACLEGKAKARKPERGATRAVMGCDAVPTLNSRTFRSEIPSVLPCSKRWEISFPATDRIDFTACGGNETRSLVISYTQSHSSTQQLSDVACTATWKFEHGSEEHQRRKRQKKVSERVNLPHQECNT